MSYLLKGIAFLGLITGLIAPVRADPPEMAPIGVSFGPLQLDGQSSIWQLAEGPRGQIIAAGERVGYYQDGVWTFLSEPRKLVIRCLFVDGDTLWISSIGEIGRIKLPLGPASRYEKLEIPGFSTAEDIWYLNREGSQLVATTSGEIWLLDPVTQKAEKKSSPNRSRIILGRIDGRLIATGGGMKPQEIVKGQIVELEPPMGLDKESRWYWGDRDYLIGLNAVYRRQGDAYQLLFSLRDSGSLSLTAATKWENYAVITTFNRGVLFIDLTTGERYFIGNATSLPSLATTQPLVDSSGRLWVATARGISLFDSFRFGHTLVTKDYPLSAFRTDGLLVNHEDRGVFYQPGVGEETRLRGYAQLSTVHGLATGYDSKIRIGEKTFATPGGKIDVVAELPNGIILAEAGDRFYSVDYQAGRAQQIPRPSGEVSGLVVIGKDLWVATFASELFKSPPSLPLAFTKVAQLPRDSSTTLHRLGDTLIAASTDHVFYGTKLQTVENTQGIHLPRVVSTSDGTLWLVGQQGGEWRLGRLKQSGGVVVWETVATKGLPLLPDVHYMSAHDTTLLVAGGPIILELNTTDLKPAYRLGPPRLQFTFQDPETGDVTTHDSAPSKLTAEKNSLTFTGSIPFDETGEKPRFERRLLPSETDWVPTKAGEKVVYPSLSSRDYTLEVRSTHLGRTGMVVSQAFTVLPPWYASPSAFVSYILGTGLFAFFTYRLRTHQIRRRNLELERIVKERTSELAEASAAKTEFLASMSHEIRNPMNGVIGLVNILREQPGLPRQANTLRLLHGCAEQLRSTVDDILDFSKIEARRVGLEESTFDLLDTLEAAAATVDPIGSSITFAQKPPAGISLRGDAAKLRQIFANYLNNALKYGVPPGAKVSTILTPADDRVRLTLSVSSTGPTIEKDKLDKLFESFTRGDDAIERNIRGTGLGLAICKRYAEAMGGEVGAVSTNGETTFYINVPFEKVAVTLASPIESVTVTPGAHTLPARALAIEDEDYNRIVLGDILAKMNYSVDWATTGAEAIQLAQENGYDIILTDYRLPDTNGVELTKKILQLCPDPKPAVFAVTAYSTRERRDECLAAGMSGFISKPITLEKLRTTIYSWGDRQLTKISLEASIRPMRPTRRSAEIETGWTELKRIATTNTKQAAEEAHRLNNLCRSLHQIDIAEQLELLEGALERHEPTGQLVSAIERLLRA
jgi:signal transduction histidine kinase/DNA-binding response OmpR family regulator